MPQKTTSKHLKCMNYRFLFLNIFVNKMHKYSLLYLPVSIQSTDRHTFDDVSTKDTKINKSTQYLTDMYNLQQ